jgi:hypothetical protein
MPYGRLDDGLYDHPKVDELGRDRLACIGLWVLCISWSNRHLTDGYVPSDRIGRLGGTKAQAMKLVAVGLLDLLSEGYRIHDFLDFNPSKADVESKRKSDRTRWRLHRGLAADSTASSPRLASDSPVPFLSVPIHTKASSARAQTGDDRDAPSRRRS